MFEVIQSNTFMVRRLNVHLSLAVSLYAVLGGCGPEKTISDDQTRNVSLVIESGPTGGESYGLTGSEPMFIGLGIRNASGELISQQLKQGENEIVVPTDADLDFRASIYSRPASGPGLVYSLASTTTKISSDLSQPAVVTLQFEAYRPAKVVNVYGLVHESATRPKSSAQVSVKDPISGALIRLEGLSSFSTTDAFGAYAFAFPIGLPFSSDSIELVIDSEMQKSHLLQLSDKGLPGYTLEPINLAGDGAVVPRFKNLNDYDEDGTLNLVELENGTNPFSPLSGAKGDKGDKGDPGVATGLIVSTLSAGSTCPSGGQSFQAFRDNNGNGVRESTELLLGRPTVSCFPAPPATAADEDVLLSSQNIEVGVLRGDTKQPLLETIYGHLVRLTTSALGSFQPERMDLHYGARDCAGQAYSSFLALGQAAYSHANGKPFTSADGRPATIVPRSVRGSNGCQNIEMTEPLPVNSPILVENSGSTSKAIDLGTRLFLSANDGVYASDGTASGTLKLGTSQSISELKKIGNKVFYNGYTSDFGSELWVSDGTTAGTRVFDLAQGAMASYPYSFHEIAGKVIFSASNGTIYQLAISDGTPTGTAFMTLAGVSSSENVYLNGFWSLGNVALMSLTIGNEAQLWRTSGTEAGTTFVKDFTAGSIDTISAQAGSVIGNVLFFTVDDGTGVKKIWKSDGTVSGTSVVFTPPNGGGVQSSRIFASGSYVYFVADAGSGDGFELWRTDGTAGGTLSLTSGSTDFDCAIWCEFFSSGGFVYGSSWSGTKRVLIRTDGSAAQTAVLASVNSNSYSKIVDFERAVVSASGIIYLPGYTDDAGWEPASIAGNSFQIIKDVQPGSGSSLGYIGSGMGNFVKSASGKIYFAAADAGSQKDLWVTDGTAIGTRKVAGRALNDGLGIDKLFVVGDKMMFGSRRVEGGELRQLHVFLEGVSGNFPKDGYSPILELDGPDIAPGTSLRLAP